MSKFGTSSCHLCFCPPQNGEGLGDMLLKNWIPKRSEPEFTTKYLWPIRQLSEVFWFGGGIAIHDLGTLIHHAHFSAISIRDQNPPLMILGGHLFQPFQCGGEKQVTWLNHSQGRGQNCLKDCFVYVGSSQLVVVGGFKFQRQLKNMSQIGPFQLFWFISIWVNRSSLMICSSWCKSRENKTLRLSRAAHRTTVQMIFQTTLLPYVWFNLKSAHLREQSSEKQSQTKNICWNCVIKALFMRFWECFIFLSEMHFNHPGSQSTKSTKMVSTRWAPTSYKRR